MSEDRKGFAQPGFRSERGQSSPEKAGLVAAPYHRGWIQFADGQLEGVDLQKPNAGGRADAGQNIRVKARIERHDYGRFPVIRRRQPGGNDLGFLGVSPVVIRENQLPACVVKVQVGIGQDATQPALAKDGPKARMSKETGAEPVRMNPLIITLSPVETNARVPTAESCRPPLSRS